MFLWRNKKSLNAFGLKKASYQELSINLYILSHTLTGIFDRCVPSVQKKCDEIRQTRWDSEMSKGKRLKVDEKG